MAKGKRDNISFEASLSELESVIDQLEKDDLTLEKALLQFEKGINMMRHCENHLRNAQGKLKELLTGENGELVTRVLGATLESFLSGEDENE